MTQPTARNHPIPVQARIALMEYAATALRRELAELTSGTDKQRGLRLVK
ncbi:MAG TPA: hypothetical protein VFI46_04700 [Jiangellaceae bacterium]|nr:hypothetical protein [Jiangellaceae bacterium]